MMKYECISFFCDWWVDVMFPKAKLLCKNKCNCICTSCNGCMVSEGLVCHNTAPCLHWCGTKVLLHSCANICNWTGEDMTIWACQYKCTITRQYKVGRYSMCPHQQCVLAGSWPILEQITNTIVPYIMTQESRCARTTYLELKWLFSFCYVGLSAMHAGSLCMTSALVCWTTIK